MNEDDVLGATQDTACLAGLKRPGLCMCESSCIRTVSAGCMYVCVY